MRYNSGIFLSYGINVTKFRISGTASVGFRPALSPPDTTSLDIQEDHRPDPKSTNLKDEDLNVDLHKRVATMCPTTHI